MQDLMFADEPVEKGIVTFKAGQAFWVDAPNEFYAIQSAGQVPMSDVAVTLRTGRMMVGNVTPVDVDLIDISVQGYDEVAEGECSVQILDKYGRGLDSFFWYDLPDDNLYGWLDGSDEPLEEGTLVLKPGEALWVDAPNSTYSLVFPGVDVK